MSSNKALQDTQSTSMTNLSPNPEIMPQSVVCERCKAGNPPSQQISVNALRAAFIKKRELCIRYKIRQEGFDVLLAINERWMQGLSSTVFSLSVNKGSDITALHYKVYNLVARGLIEHVGFGNSMSKTYAPTREGMRVIDELFPV